MSAVCVQNEALFISCGFMMSGVRTVRDGCTLLIRLLRGCRGDFSYLSSKQISPVKLMIAYCLQRVCYKVF